MRKYNYETPDPNPWPDPVSVYGFDGVACWVQGWEIEPDRDTEWTGIEHKTGRLIISMVGDDALHPVDPEDIKPLKRSEYCSSCGQIGCRHDGYDRSQNG